MGKKGNRELELKNLNTKDSSVRSIWTWLAARPCYTTNTPINMNRQER